LKKDIANHAKLGVVVGVYAKGAAGTVKFRDFSAVEVDKE
jgi:hypothetical protein